MAFFNALAEFAYDMEAQPCVSICRVDGKRVDVRSVKTLIADLHLCSTHVRIGILMYPRCRYVYKHIFTFHIHTLHKYKCMYVCMYIYIYIIHTQSYTRK